MLKTDSEIVDRLLLRQATSLEFTGHTADHGGFVVVVTRDVAESEEGEFVFVRHFGRHLHLDATVDAPEVRPRILVVRGGKYAWWPWDRDRPAVDDDWSVHRVTSLREAALFAISLCDGDVECEEQDPPEGDDDA